MSLTGDPDGPAYRSGISVFDVMAGLYATIGTGDEAVPMIRHPISFSLTPPRHNLPPPALGQDNEQIRAWLSQTEAIDPEQLTTARTPSEQG